MVTFTSERTCFSSEKHGTKYHARSAHHPHNVAIPLPPTLALAQRLRDDAAPASPRPPAIPPPTGRPLNLHLLMPLGSSVMFVFGMMFASRAIRLGATPWTGTFYANLWLGLLWCGIGLYHCDPTAAGQWPYAILSGVLFTFGQLFTYLAFRVGDVSVATPVFGVKILIVTLLTAAVTDVPVAPKIWYAAVLATVGIGVIQWRPRSKPAADSESESTSGGGAKAVALTIGLALLAALCLSIFDIVLQEHGTKAGSLRFLPVVFASAAVCSCGLLPFIDRFSELREMSALRPMLIGSLLMTVQAIGMCVALSGFGDATRVNVVFSLRGLWGVVLAWLFAKSFDSGERHLPRSVMICRLIGATLLTSAVVIALV